MHIYVCECWSMYVCVSVSACECVYASLYMHVYLHVNVEGVHVIYGGFIVAL